MDKDGKIISLIAWVLVCYGVYHLGYNSGVKSVEDKNQSIRSMCSSEIIGTSPDAHIMGMKEFYNFYSEQQFLTQNHVNAYLLYQRNHCIERRQ